MLAYGPSAPPVHRLNLSLSDYSQAAAPVFLSENSRINQLIDVPISSRPGLPDGPMNHPRRIFPVLEANARPA